MTLSRSPRCVIFKSILDSLGHDQQLEDGVLPQLIPPLHLPLSALWPGILSFSRGGILCAHLPPCLPPYLQVPLFNSRCDPSNDTCSSAGLHIASLLAPVIQRSLVLGLASVLEQDTKPQNSPQGPIYGV